MWIHRLVDRDDPSGFTVCSMCGPVDVKKGRCGNALREYRRKYDATRQRTRTPVYGPKPEPKQKDPIYGPPRQPGALGRKRGRITPHHGLTDKQREAMLAEVDGCEICGATDYLHVDHCHVTGKIRGVLCVRHNTALGSFGDSIEKLEAAIEYLRKYS